MRIYPVKENPIGSAVSEIFWYRHTENKQTNILLLWNKDYSVREKRLLTDYYTSPRRFKIIFSYLLVYQLWGH